MLANQRESVAAVEAKMEDDKQLSNYHRPDKELSIVNLNARSIRLKSSELEVFLHNERYPEIVCVTETWLTSTEAPCYNLNNYYNAASFSRKDTRAGGVSIFIHNKISKFSTLDLNEIPATEKNFEAVATLVEMPGNIKVIVCCLYHSPSSDYDVFCKSLEKLLVYLDKRNVYSLVCGDFNYNFLCNSRETVNIVNIFSSYGMTKSFHEPSRIQGPSCTLIDNIFTNMSTAATKTVHLTFSDHNAQLLYIDLGECAHADSLPKLKKRSFSTENVNHFNFLLSKESWINLQTLSLDNKFTYFISIFRQLFDISFPCTYKRQNINKKHNPWITDAIVMEGKDLRKLCAGVKSSNDPDLKTLYKTKQKEHKNNITRAKQAFNSEKIRNSSNVSKAAWDVINTHTVVKQKKKGMPEKMISADVEVTGQNNIACAFNSHFIESINKLLGSNADQPNVRLPKNGVSQTIYLAPLVENETMEIIRSVSHKTSSGFDEIPCDLLIKCAHNILSPLTYLINISFEYGYFPQELNQAIVIPIYKKGNMSSIENYRPIALLSVFSKIFEKAFRRRLVSFLVSYRILNCEQFGFRIGLSTVDAILSFYMRILNNFNDKLKTVGIFFDFTKAFDTINHGLLLRKLAHYGVRGPALDWLKMYLSGRTQAVRLSGSGGTVFSDWMDVDVGVPQGSVLGPILFLLFINDLPLAVSSGLVTLFADDTSAVVSGGDWEDLCTRANWCVAEIADWCKANSLFLNCRKTNFMLFTPVRVTQDRSLLIKDNNTSLQQQKNTTFLGITIDHHLSWGDHIDTLCAKLSSKNYAILQLRDFVDIGTLKMFYYATVQSILAYGVLAWGNSSHIGRVLISQKRIIRNMFRLQFRQSCRDTFKSQGILTVVNLYILQCACFVFKHRDKLPKYSDINHYITRNSEMLYVPSFRLSQIQDGPEITSLRIYNHLPANVKELTLQHRFRAKVKAVLVHNPFYCISEYFRCTF